MKGYIKNLLYFTFLFYGMSCFAAASVKPYALIYSGPDSCEGCPEAIADVANMAHLPVKYVSDPEQIPDLLKHAAFFAIGGTDDDIEDMREAFNKNIVASIRQYLAGGGHYLGICGGAFIASTYYMADKHTKVKGFDIVPAFAVDYSDTSAAHLETLSWNGRRVTLYFQGGPTFLLKKNAGGIHVIARYSNGDIAALEYGYGKGNVVLIGPHPEADKSWLVLDGINPAHWNPRPDLLLTIIKKML